MAYPWQAYGFFMTLYDDMYFFVFVAIAWIWAPGKQSFQYSLYSQVSTGVACMTQGTNVLFSGDFMLSLSLLKHRQALGDVETAESGGGDVPVAVELSAVRASSGSAAADDEAFDDFGPLRKESKAAAGTFVIEEEEEGEGSSAAAAPAPTVAVQRQHPEVQLKQPTTAGAPSPTAVKPNKLPPPPSAKRSDGLAAQAGDNVDTSQIGVP
jgi:hypothetical protein